MHSGVRLLSLTVAAAILAVGQNPNQGAGAGAGGGNTNPNPGGNVPPGSPGSLPQPGQPGRPGQPGQPGDIFNQDRFPSMDRQMPIFLSGKVMLDDGTPPPEPVTIERVCNGGSPRPEGYTDSKGRFSIQLGNNMGMMPDASVSNADDVSDITRNPRGGMNLPGQNRGFSERELHGCEIRASLPGYRSQAVPLSGRRFLDNPDLGTILMKRLGEVEGRTLSMTSLAAPKDAKKAYEKGMNALKKKKKDEEAQREFDKAVAIYPEYAAAWFELGMIRERSQQDAAAREAYQKALAADSKYVKPYLQLAGIAMREQNWQDVSDTTGRVLKLNPFDYPSAYFFNAVANFNLKKYDEAEKSAREGLKQDDMRRIPKLEHVLGVILAQKNDLPGAAEHMRAYLKFAPQAADVETVRTQLAQVEKLLGSAPAAAPAPPQEQ